VPGKGVFQKPDQHSVHSGFFCNSFPAFLKKAGAKSNARFIPDSGHRFSDGLKPYGRFLLGAKDFILEGPETFFPICKIKGKVPYFQHSFLGRTGASLLSWIRQDHHDRSP
jgi:hypothetical protein